MPLRANVDDFIAWHFDTKGEYSVKQAYKLQVQLNEINLNGGQSGSNFVVGNLEGGGDDCWRRIWRVPCPPKIHMFIWRLSHNSLTLRPNLVKRGVQIESVKCLFCNNDVEEGAHLFVKCRYVKEVWHCLGMENIRRDLARSSSIEHALDIIWNGPVEMRVQILTFWWLWWYNRNKLREGEKPLEATSIAHKTRCCAVEYLEILGSKSNNITNEITKWKPPGLDVLKFNTDGAFTPGQNEAGWVVIVHDHREEVVATTTGRSEHTSDAFHAELIAVVQAVRLAEQLGAIHVVLETDSQLLMAALKN
jgi:hypothetical protein